MKNEKKKGGNNEEKEKITNKMKGANSRQKREGKQYSKWFSRLDNGKYCIIHFGRSQNTTMPREMHLLHWERQRTTTIISVQFSRL